MLDIYSDAKIVLVVEKEASFQRLMDDGLLEKLKPCIAITVNLVNFQLVFDQMISTSRRFRIV
jgi:hypothetical protein